MKNVNNNIADSRAISDLEILLDDLARSSDQRLNALTEGRSEHIVHAERKHVQLLQVVLSRFVGEPKRGGAGERGNHRGRQTSELGNILGLQEKIVASG